MASGSAALMQQAAWFRLLMPVLGVGVLSAAAVSAGALLGLAIGALLGGRLADRSGRPGLVFAVAELGAALSCLAVPLGVGGLDALLGLRPTGDGATLGTDLLGSVGAVLICGAAAAPMGATLPAAVRAVGATRDAVGSSFRRLYGWNTVGAVLGVVLAVGVLLEHTGNLGLVYLASAVQVGVALLALAFFRRRRAPPAVAAGRSPVPRRLAWAAFLAGGAGLVVQIAWVRRITPVVGNTTYAFAAVLATYLLALALGSLLLGPRRGRGPTRGPLITLVAASIPVALLPFGITWVGEWSAARLAQAQPTQLELIGIQAAATALLLVPSTIIGAAVLPWLLRAAAPSPEHAGRGAGRLLYMNTAGSALFALATALVWLPLTGSAAALRGAAGVYLGAGALLAGGALRAVLGVLGLLLVLQPLLLPIEDHALWRVAGATFAPDRYIVHDAPLVMAREGRTSTVVVRDREDRPELWVDSKIVASVGPTDRLHLALLGHLPMLLHPDPKHVAVIGLGTGISSQAAARWAPETLDIHELEPAVVEAARHFEAFGGGVPLGARIRLGDGRQGIERSGRRYDVVTSDPIHPAVAGAAALYGAEHYRMLRARADLVCQWLPLYQMRLEDARLVVRTFAAVFEHTYVFLLGPDAILIGTPRPLRLDEGRLRERLASAAGADLAFYGLRAPGRLLGLLVQGPKGARAFGAEGPLNTDDQLRLEFACARSWYVDEIATIARYLRLGRADAASVLDAAPTPAFRRELEHAAQFHRAMRVWLDWDNARAVDELEALRRLVPGNRLAASLRDETLIEAARDDFDEGRTDEGGRRLRALLSRRDIEDALRLDAAELLIGAGFAADGRAVARHLARTKGWPRALRLAGETGASAPR